MISASFYTTGPAQHRARLGFPAFGQSRPHGRYEYIMNILLFYIHLCCAEKRVRHVPLWRVRTVFLRRRRRGPCAPEHRRGRMGCGRPQRDVGRREALARRRDRPRAHRRQGPEAPGMRRSAATWRARHHPRRRALRDGHPRRLGGRRRRHARRLSRENRPIMQGRQARELERRASSDDLPSLPPPAHGNAGQAPEGGPTP